MLCLQALVAEVEVDAVHIPDILVVQFLRGRGLVALAPRGPQPQFSQLQHRRDLRGQTGAETLVAGQTESCCQVERVEQRQFVLHIDGSCMVRRLATLHPHRGLQPVVAVLQPRAQPLLIGQREDTFQRDVRQLLVALQVTLSREVGEIVGEPAVDVAVGQRRVRKGIVVGVPLPVGIEGDDVGRAELPLAADRSRGIIVLHIVGLDVYAGVMAAGAVDAFPV